MALDGAQLQVTVSADVAPLLGAMNEAKAAVSSSADRMAASFKAAGLSSTDAASAMKNLQFTAEESSAALRAVGYEAAGTAPKLRSIAIASAEARVELASLTGSTGAAEFGLAKLGAASLALNPLISAAFPVFAAVTFIEIADQAVTGVQKLYDHFVSLKDQEDEVTAATTKLAESTYQYGQEALRAREATIGMLVGPAAEAKQKLTDLTSTVYPLKIDDKELKDVPKHIREFIDSLSTAPGGIGIPAEQISASITKVNDELKRQQQIAAEMREEMANGTSGGDAGALTFMEQEAHQAEINANALQIVLTNVTTMQDQYNQKKLEGLGSQRVAERREAEKALHEEIEISKDKYTAQEQANLKSIAQQQAALQAKLAANQDSGNDELTQLSALDKQKSDIELAADKRQQAAEQARKAQAEANRIAGQELRDQNELAADSQRMARADLETIDKKIRAEQELAVATIRGIEMVSASQARKDEAQAARDLSAKKITPQQEGALLAGDETKRHTGRVDELNALAGVEQDPAKLATIHAQLLTEQNDFESAMAKIKDDADKKTSAAQMQYYDRQVSAATTSANRALEVAMRADQEKLKHHDISAQQWVTSERAALNQWYAEQATTLNASLAFAERTYGKDEEHYAALIRKKEQLDQEYAAKSAQITNKLHDLWLQVTRKMGTEFESTINKLAMGEESWAQISKQLYGEVASTFITNSTKMLEQAIVAEVTHKALLKTEILGDAAASAAHAFKWVMADVPFPANAALAPAAAAAAFGAVMAFGSFETGGLALQTGPYILHQGEGVMTARQTAAIERAGEVTNNGGARTFNQEVTVNHKGSNLSDAAFAKIMHRVMRKGLFSLR